MNCATAVSGGSTRKVNRVGELVDWDLAVRTAVRFASPGPSVTSEEARSVVADLRWAAEAAVDPVARVTGLHCPPNSAETVVVDRPAWIRSAAEGFRWALAPSLEQMSSKSSGTVAAVGSRVSGVQLGGILAWMSSKVLGQYEAFHAPDQRPRLLLVAPNIRSVEHTLELEPRDFRLWVALHEETHRVQFGSVPWLADHLLNEVGSLLSISDLSGDEVIARLSSAVRSVGSGGSLVEALHGPEQQVVVDRLTALMSLLEGHADHVMDVAAPALIPSLPTIRARFDARRTSPGAIEGLIRRLLGLDAKLRQYTEGAAFVRTVVDRVGMAGFNAIWTSAQTLPSLAEIREPLTWVERAHSTGFVVSGE